MDPYISILEKMSSSGFRLVLVLRISEFLVLLDRTLEGPGAS